MIEWTISKQWNKTFKCKFNHRNEKCSRYSETFSKSKGKKKKFIQELVIYFIFFALKIKLKIRIQIK